MKLKNDDLLKRIEENILVTGELIKSCGYLSLQKGYESPLVDEFFDAHTNALINSEKNIFVIFQRAIILLETFLNV